MSQVAGKFLQRSLHPVCHRPGTGKTQARMIKLENINKTYNNGSPLHVLKGINLEVEKGELVSIMGASG